MNNVNILDIINEMNICTLYKDSVKRQIPFDLSTIQERHHYVTDSNLMTLIHYAVLYRDIRTVTFLLDKDVSPNIKGTSLNRTPLFFSTDPDISVLLITQGATVNETDNEGNTPLHCAIERFMNNTDDISLFFKNIKILLWNGADPSIKNDENVSPRDMYDRIFVNEQNDGEDTEVKEMMKKGDDELSDITEISEVSSNLWSSVESLEGS
jgi:ankyrin repeat protein